MRWVPGASGIEVVTAAMIAPVSSKLHSLRVMAARITTSCHSKGMARARTHSLQPAWVRLRKVRTTSSGASSSGSSTPITMLIGRLRTNCVSRMM
ncbi:hypothetical protein D3C78_1216020 [compost metagenome]